MDGNQLPDRQEMFNRAVRGLRGQGFRQAIKDVRTVLGGLISSICMYQTPDGLRCAWGHVDTSMTTQEGSVTTLREGGYGIAARLTIEDARWADELQHCHDDPSSADPHVMEGLLMEFGQKHSLEWPQ